MDDTGRCSTFIALNILHMRRILATILLIVFCGTLALQAQPPRGIHWTADGNGYYEADAGEIIQVNLVSGNKTVIVTKQQLTPAGAGEALKVRNYFFSADGKKLLVYANSKRVWRYDTRGDYWVLNLADGKLTQLGKTLPASSLMFAKFSPDATKAAYVSGHNIYVEDLAANTITQLTKDGTDRLINGTFDWAYEEEFGCRDGFRWSPDGKSIAYWQIDARDIRNFLMINNTDSIYSYTVPVEYPKVGESPSACRVGVADIKSGVTTWMKVPGDAQQHYIPRMEWAANSTEVAVQQLNRKQNEGIIFYCNAKTGSAQEIYRESDKAWIDPKTRWNNDDPTGWEWVQQGKAFLWVSEKDGWRHIYLVGRDGKKETLLTKGEYDIISIKAIDEKNGYVYCMASPDNATQQYLFRVSMDGSGTKELLSPANEKGTHDYDVSPGGLFAQHSFSSAATQGYEEWVSLPGHAALEAVKKPPMPAKSNVEFFQVTTEDGVTMDGWMVKPANFDSTKKYPVVFYVYTEPAGTTVTDSWGAGYNFLYPGMRQDGYIYMSLDGRGTPAHKGAAWRKAIYRKVGIINIRDQAMAAKKIMQWPYVDSSRLAVWGWSGGGSATLNLLFQYPEIYSTGIAVAAVANQLTYDNIYQERYMGIPQENREDFIKGSPITYAKNLKGHLLYIHGTGDDNVHYQNAELLINEMVRYNKQFQLMSYPNRSHGLSEGTGTFTHLSTLYKQFLNTWCPPGPR